MMSKDIFRFNYNSWNAETKKSMRYTLALDMLQRSHKRLCAQFAASEEVRCFQDHFDVAPLNKY